MDSSTRLIDLTVADLEQLVAAMVKKAAPQPAVEPQIVYGIEGLAAFLHRSKSTAMRLKKSGIINDAIHQVGRTIIVDTRKLRQIINIQNTNV